MTGFHLCWAVGLCWAALAAARAGTIFRCRNMLTVEDRLDPPHKVLQPDIGARRPEVAPWVIFGLAVSARRGGAAARHDGGWWT